MVEELVEVFLPRDGSSSIGFIHDFFGLRVKTFFPSGSYKSYCRLFSMVGIIRHMLHLTRMEMFRQLVPLLFLLLADSIESILSHKLSLMLLAVSPPYLLLGIWGDTETHEVLREGVEVVLIVSGLLPQVS